MKKVARVLFVAVLMFIAMPTCRAEAAESAPTDFGDPIEILEYDDEEGNHVIERIYFVPADDSGISEYSNSSGEGWYKNEKEHEWSGNGTMTYYAQGYFVWGDGDVTCTQMSGGVENVPSNVKISKETTEGGSGRYGFVFNKYSSVTYSFTATTSYGIEQDFSVTVRVSESGNNI